MTVYICVHVFEICFTKTKEASHLVDLIINSSGYFKCSNDGLGVAEIIGNGGGVHFNSSTARASTCFSLDVLIIILIFG